MTKELLHGLDLATVERLDRAGFIRASLEPYLKYHAEYVKQLELKEGRIQDALEACAEICYADQLTIRRAVNKVSLLLTS